MKPFAHLVQRHNSDAYLRPQRMSCVRHTGRAVYDLLGNKCRAYRATHDDLIGVLGVRVCRTSGRWACETTRRRNST